MSPLGFEPTDCRDCVSRKRYHFLQVMPKVPPPVGAKFGHFFLLFRDKKLSFFIFIDYNWVEMIILMVEIGCQSFINVIQDASDSSVRQTDS